MPTPKFTARHQRFCEEFLVDCVVAAAARRAGVSERRAKQTGNEWMGRADVQAEIKRLMTERAERTGITADRVLAELAVVGFSSLWHYTVQSDGRVVLAENAPPEAIRAVSKIKHKVRTTSRDDGETTVEHEVELALWDKNTALQSIGRHLGMFVDKTEVKDTTVERPGRLTPAERDVALAAFLAARRPPSAA